MAFDLRGRGFPREPDFTPGEFGFLLGLAADPKPGRSSGASPVSDGAENRMHTIKVVMVATPG
ncbi:hypothetical protein [Actinomadura sp. 3N407]|uniref:hypothetical protein n=1 Tax=Actinomadura sp. 3N407 TaxID=3457423 RepID=UPI003FCE1B59